jgi:hypothetical protein
MESHLFEWNINSSLLYYFTYRTVDDRLDLASSLSYDDYPRFSYLKNRKHIINISADRIANQTCETDDAMKRDYI